MKIKNGILGVIGSFMGCTLASAGQMGPFAISSGLHPVFTLQGGYASMNVRTNTQRFVGTDSQVFTYTNSSSGINTGFIGVFVGAEHQLPWFDRPGFMMQTGVDYKEFGNLSVKGINTVGIEPQTSTTYQYNYNFQTRQILGTLRVLSTTHERFHPYGEVGLGAALNHGNSYSPTTTDTGSINLTPSFSNHSNTQFSYTLGLGVDTQVQSNIRVGLGYQYSNFGLFALNNGVVSFNNYQSPVSFALGGSNAYANQLIARISYVA